MPLSALKLTTAILIGPQGSTLRQSAILSVLNAAVRRIVRLPKFSHIASFMINQLHWLPLSARLEFKILVLKSKLGVAPKYRKDHINSTLSATSHPPILTSDWQVLFVPRVKTAMAQTRSFATIGPYRLPLECSPCLSSL